MDDKTPEAVAKRTSAHRAVVRRLLDVEPASREGDARAQGRGIVTARLVAALDVEVQDRDGQAWVQYEIVLCLHARSAGRARVVLHDERARELLRVFEEDLSSNAVARVPGGFPLAGDCELWCEAVLLDDREARAVAFAGVARRRRDAGRRE